MEIYIYATNRGNQIKTDCNVLQPNDYINKISEMNQFLQMIKSYYQINTQRKNDTENLKTIQNRIKELIDICSRPIFKIMDLIINILEIQKEEYSH
jgi:hypothetical protein